MKTPRSFRNLARACCAAAVIVLAASRTSAQAVNTGSIEGRVLNSDNGSYLTNARVTIEGTTTETFTDSSGHFRVTNLPSGPVRVKIFYTGLVEQTIPMLVQAGETSAVDVSLSGSATAPQTTSEVVRLDRFVVEAKRDMDNAAIAINEQRFAANLKNVVSTDAFGDVTEGNLGDFAKFLPGITIDYAAADARTISIRGVSANYTAVTIDGNEVASANSSNAGRTFELEQVSLNNTSRLEVFKSRTPDIAASALGGSVNLVPRSAFEKVKPSFSYRAFVSANGDEKSLSTTRGPGREPSRKIKPGFDFAYVRPVTKNFGFTLSVLHSDIFNPQNETQPTWAPNSGASAGATVQAPYLKNYLSYNGPKTSLRQSLGTTVDWRFAANDMLSLGAQWNRYDAHFFNRRVTYDVGNAVPVSFGPDFTNGAIGRGSMTSGGEQFRQKFGYTYQADFKWRHTGPVWKLDSGVSFSHATNHYHDYQNGHFQTALLTLRGLPDTSTSNLTPTVQFANLAAGGYMIPTTIRVLDANGVNPIDVSSPANYNLTSTNTNPADSVDLFKTARVNAKRDFSLAVPFSLKAGLQLQQQTRDIEKPNPGNLNFVGPDGKTNTADDNAALYDIFDPQYSGKPFLFNLPVVPIADHYKVYRLYQDHPNWFVPASSTAIVSNTATNSQWFQETISAAYLMGDARLVGNRLRLVAGVRFERTEDEAYGALNNPNAAKGSADPVAAAKAQFKVRGSHTKKSYSGAYPSLDASVNVRENVIARASYARSIGRPDMGNIIPNVSVPDVTSASRTITVVNTGLKPAQTNAYDFSLEYYFSKTGVFSVGVFRKDFSNFVGSLPLTVATLDLLNQLNVPNPEAYADGTYNISTKANVGSARVTGVEFNYSQVLDASWLPAWTHNFTLFANGQKLHLAGSTLSDFSAFIPASGSCGVKYGARQFSAQINCNYRGRQRLGALAAVPGGFDYFAPRVYLDTNFEFRATKHVGFFLNVRNLTNVLQLREHYGPDSPGYSRAFRNDDFGVSYTLGVKGSF